eukprot:CAMPEP_0206334346 /NCGR_PEP_ID=MMETSP0106_2-20121207/25747_1 /ASSEMBLY_ACC=CAM_ASM_000206 /TAXON_ID=81532 /ORGANISM="Acanthoeca-like sp., Strain 10tr" /LENGTH=84 /DNA_ID=CAMNT_0053767253 /DNA_START=24 /DNA_END=274 /DNA_ORIENTATION=+
MATAGPAEAAAAPAPPDGAAIAAPPPDFMTQHWCDVPDDNLRVGPPPTAVAAPVDTARKPDNVAASNTGRREVRLIDYLTGHVL